MRPAIKSIPDKISIFSVEFPGIISLQFMRTKRKMMRKTHQTYARTRVLKRMPGVLTRSTKDPDDELSVCINIDISEPGTEFLVTPWVFISSASL